MKPISFKLERIHHADASVRPYKFYVNIGEDTFEDGEGKNRRILERHEQYWTELSVIDFENLYQAIQDHQPSMLPFGTGKVFGMLFTDDYELFSVGETTAEGEDLDEYLRLVEEKDEGADALAEKLMALVRWTVEIPMTPARWKGLKDCLETVHQNSHAVGEWTDSNPMQVPEGTKSPVIEPT